MVFQKFMQRTKNLQRKHYVLASLAYSAMDISRENTAGFACEMFWYCSVLHIQNLNKLYSLTKPIIYTN